MNREARKFAKASLIWFALMVGMTSFAASASQAAVKKSKAPTPAPAPAQEIYSATEAEDDATMAAKPVQIHPRVSGREELRAAPVTAAIATPVVRHARPATAPLATAVQSPAFDPVPSDQSSAMIQRLKLVELLVQRHGRAYDYRVHTVRELQTVLAQMDASLAPAKRAAPRMQIAVPAAPSETPALPPAPTESDESMNENPGA